MNSLKIDHSLKVRLIIQCVFWCGKYSILLTCWWQNGAEQQVSDMDNDQSDQLQWPQSSQELWSAQNIMSTHSTYNSSLQFVLYLPSINLQMSTSCNVSLCLQPSSATESVLDNPGLKKNNVAVISGIERLSSESSVETCWGTSSWSFGSARCSSALVQIKTLWFLIWVAVKTSLKDVEAVNGWVAPPTAVAAADSGRKTSWRWSFSPNHWNLTSDLKKGLWQYCSNPIPKSRLRLCYLKVQLTAVIERDGWALNNACGVCGEGFTVETSPGI